MDKIFDDMLYEIPFLDYNLKNTSIDNKIQLGNPYNPCSATIIDGLNIGNTTYDSAFIISCPEYLKDGHSQNFIEDFKKRYNINPVLINIEEKNIDNIIREIQNNNKNIFLKIDLCNRKIYDLLNQIDQKKYIQIVCTELPLPVFDHEIKTLNNYIGNDTSQSVLDDIGLKNNPKKSKSEHYLVNFQSRWSINENNWYQKSKNENPELQLVTFLKPEMSNYIKIIEIGNSENPQKNLKVDMNYSANIIFNNEFSVYPDIFSCYIKNKKNQDEIVVSRIDKTRMGWGQNLKAVTNVQFLPKISTCVFVRKDIFNDNRFIPFNQNQIPSENLDIQLNSFNTNIEFNNPFNKKNNKNFTYWSPINIEGYKKILTKIIQNDFVKDNFEQKLVPKQKIQNLLKKKKEEISLVLPNNSSMIKLLKNIFISVDILEQATLGKDLRSIYISLIPEDKKKFKLSLLKIVLSHILITKKGETSALNEIILDKNKSYITIKNKTINIKDTYSKNKINAILTNDYVSIKKNIQEKHLQSFQKIKQKIDIEYLKFLKNYNSNYKILPEIVIILKEIL